jgi:hypothetical protein
MGGPVDGVSRPHVKRAQVLAGFPETIRGRIVRYADLEEQREVVEFSEAQIVGEDVRLEVFSAA